MATLDDLLGDDEDEAFENSEAARAIMSRFTDGAPPQQNGMMASGVPASQQGVVQGYGVPHPGYFVPPPHMQGMHGAPPQAQMVQMGHPRAHMFPLQNVPVQGMPARQLAPNQYAGGVGQQHPGGGGQPGQANRHQGGEQRGASGQQRGGGSQQRGQGQQSGGGAQQQGGREGQRLQIPPQVLAQLRTMRREDLQAKYVGARKILKELAEKQKNNGPLSEPEKKQFQQANYLYQACTALVQELQAEKGPSLTEFLGKRLPAAGFEHFKRLSQAVKVGSIDRVRFYAELEKLCGPDLYKELGPFFKSKSTSGQPQPSAQPSQLARQGPLPPAVNQATPSIPHPSRQQANPPQQTMPAPQQFIPPQQANPNPDAVNPSPAESAGSVGPVESASEAKLSRINTSVLRNAYVTASTKHPPKASPPLPPVTREASPVVASQPDAVSDGESPEPGGSAEPKAAEEETPEERKKRQKREANRKTTEKRRKAREEKLRLERENGGGAQAAEAQQKGESPPAAEKKDEERGETASPDSDSEDRPIGAGLGGSTANLPALAKGGTPPIAVRAGSVPPAKKAPAKSKAKKTAAPAEGPKKAPKPKGKRPPSAQPPASAPAPSPELLAIKSEILEHSASGNLVAPANSGVPAQQLPGTAPQSQAPTFTPPNQTASATPPQSSANGPVPSNPGAQAQPPATSAPPPQPTIVPPPTKPSQLTGGKTIAIGGESGAQKGKGRGQGKKAQAAAAGGVKRPGEGNAIGQGKAKKQKTDSAPAQTPPVQTLQYNQWIAANPQSPLPAGVVVSAPPLGGVLTAPPLSPALGGVKRPSAAAGAQQPAQKKQQRDDDVTRLQDVTAVAGLDLEQEAQQSMALAGPIGDSSANEEARLRIAEEEDRLFVNEAVLRARASGLAAKRGIPRVGEDVYKCLSMAVEDRLRGMLHRLVKLSKQRTDVRKGRFFTYTHYNTREEVLKIRTREEAVFGAREAREQEKLRQMLAKKNKGPLTDPELEKRRQDALKLKEKDEEKRRAEAAMSTAMAALGKSSLARFTANYGKGVAKGPAGPSAKPPTAANPPTATPPSAAAPTPIPSAPATPRFLGSNSRTPASNPGLEASSSGLPAPASASGTPGSNPGLPAPASGLPASTPGLPSAVANPLPPTAGQDQPAPEQPAVDPAVPTLPTPDHTNPGLPSTNPELTLPNPAPTSGPLSASEGIPVTASGVLPEALSAPPAVLTADPLSAIVAPTPDTLPQPISAPLPEIANPSVEPTEKVTPPVALDGFTEVGGETPAVATPPDAAIPGASTEGGALSPALATPAEVAVPQPTNTAMDTPTLPQPELDPRSASPLPPSIPPAFPAAAPSLPSGEAPSSTEPSGAPSDAQSAVPPWAPSVVPSGAPSVVPSDIPVFGPSGASSSSVPVTILAQAPTSVLPEASAAVPASTVPSVVPLALSPGTPAAVPSEMTPAAPSVSLTLKETEAKTQAPEAVNTVPAASLMPSDMDLGDPGNRVSERSETAAPTGGSLGEEGEPAGATARAEEPSAVVPNGPGLQEPGLQGSGASVVPNGSVAVGATRDAIGGNRDLDLNLVGAEASVAGLTDAEKAGQDGHLEGSVLPGELRNGDIRTGSGEGRAVAEGANGASEAVVNGEGAQVTDRPEEHFAGKASGPSKDGEGDGAGDLAGPRTEQETETEGKGTPEGKLETERNLEPDGVTEPEASAMDVDVRLSAVGTETSTVDVSNERDNVPESGGEQPGAVPGPEALTGGTESADRNGGLGLEAPRGNGTEFPEGDIGLEADEEMWEAGEGAPVSGGLEAEGGATSNGEADPGAILQNGLGELGAGTSTDIHVDEGASGGTGSGMEGVGEEGAAQQDGNGVPAENGVNGPHETGVKSPPGADVNAATAMDVDPEGEADLLAGPRLAPLKRAGQKQKGLELPSLPGSDVRAPKPQDRGTKRSEPEAPTETPIDPALQPQSFSLARRRVANVFPPNRSAAPQQARAVTLKDLVALLEKEPQMAKSAVLYKLYCRTQWEQGRGPAGPR
ncbi:Transcription initiation factor TFIID subunit [Klebsormidium nitens]|uniref:Transcription initiation factor TFIID subunit n=1 Tax=Klebsormidium nitens TaxID=105231 RepID=A0A1Y1I6Y2_KLENI|nr:Transcription initiation factor TFIID subunit [Klebsormidium nitens]|eukprot:GAQ84901.1 Transcription initiation factor TFIID subunit [Klebsormidium nitens]